MTLRILALDLASVQAGVVRPEGRIGRLACPVRGIPRLAWWYDTVARLCTDADLVVFEGYAYATNDVAHSLGEAGGIARLAAYDAEVPQVDVSPTSLKMYATGRGNAKKALVFAEAVRRLSYQGESYDEAEALWLWHMAHDAYGYPRVAVPAAHRRALKAVRWPSLLERPEARIGAPNAQPGGSGA